jgi:hypothetical protein
VGFRECSQQEGVRRYISRRNAESSTGAMPRRPEIFLQSQTQRM